MSRQKRWLIAGVVIVLLIASDQVTKRIAITYLQNSPPIIFPGDLFRFQFAWNTGAFLSLGAGLPDWLRGPLLTTLNVGILAAVGAVLVWRKELRTILVWALALIFAGGFGNLIDRIAYDGRVSDFMNIGIGSLRSGIFNIADLAIVAGLLLVIAGEFLGDRKPERAPGAPDSTAHD